MDPVEEMLVKKYNVSPEDAANMALDIRHGGKRTGNEDNPINKMAKEEAYTDVANGAISHLNRMAKNAAAFTRMHKLKQEGGALSDYDEKWYQLVLNKQREAYQNTAGQRTAQMNSLAGTGAAQSTQRGQQLGQVALQGIDRTNNMVDTAMGAEQTKRDQIANQLIPQPQNVMPPVQMQVQPNYPGFDQGSANMDPAIAAYVAHMQGQGRR